MTAGLRKVGNYEEVLAQAMKDEQHVGGVINPYLANAATRIINNPEFQRVKDRLEDDLTQQTRNHLDQKNFEHHVTNLAVDARINRSDLDYIIQNLQQPPPPPAPAPTAAAASASALEVGVADDEPGSHLPFDIVDLSNSPLSLLGDIGTHATTWSCESHFDVDVTICNFYCVN